MELAKKIKQAMQTVASLVDCQLEETIGDETVLLESGLDSLGYAMLVAQLQEDLGTDPFTELGIVDYPVTFADFVAIYQLGLANKAKSE